MLHSVLIVFPIHSVYDQYSGNIKKTLALVSQTADSICDGDLVEKLVRQKGNWSMLPMQVRTREMKVNSTLIHW